MYKVPCISIHPLATHHDVVQGLMYPGVKLQARSSYTSKATNRTFYHMKEITPENRYHALWSMKGWSVQQIRFETYEMPPHRSKEEVCT